jgi:hypothetical protein
MPRHEAPDGFIVGVRMTDRLDHPAMQADILPFVVAFALAWPLARTRWLAVDGRR